MDEFVAKKVYVETYGCQMNISDGELMEGILVEKGYEVSTSAEEADVIIVNTCAIREHAEERVLGRVGQLYGIKKERPEVIIGVTGCMAQRLGDNLLQRAPYVDLVMGPDGYRSLPEQLERIHIGAKSMPSRSSKKRGPQLAVLDLDVGENYEGLVQRRTSPVSAWVPIQRGCDHKCTFCIVPYVRGPEKNRKSSDILNEVREIAEAGRTEVTLLGQTVNSYESDGVSFHELLRSVARIDGIRRVRFTSPHPNDVTPELLRVMAEESAICEQLHLPLQSGNDKVLRRMLRRYTVDTFLEKVTLARDLIPDLSLSTDIIVAFPGESEDQFEDTLDLLRQVRFDDAYTYKYSLRDGTPATRFPESDFLSNEEAQIRLTKLIEVHRSIQNDINKGEVGRIEEVLVEKKGRETSQVLGRTRRNKVVAFNASSEIIGTYHQVLLTGTTGATFIGELAN
ncbi:MAG: tRNA (N6-isopentenyl adenosine(37)-C2)-methylthiotransferase MiaB [Gemmatimonadetes bacterium]|nr:tRNA (N6-isopentenyl adenosine(37)-C2)-methylthiotransferase MiaB [Gemmatimonadota bacterium]|tara:strand:+ start:3601 stop:4959 length:1359 start_codon:yes stop_codon:yes gene_type:complete